MRKKAAKFQESAERGSFSPVLRGLEALFPTGEGTRAGSQLDCISVHPFAAIVGKPGMVFNISRLGAAFSVFLQFGT